MVKRAFLGQFRLGILRGLVTDKRFGPSGGRQRRHKVQNKKENEKEGKNLV